MKRIGLDTWVKIAALVEALVVVVSALFIAAQQHLQPQELSAQTAINTTSLHRTHLPVAGRAGVRPRTAAGRCRLREALLVPQPSAGF